MMNLLHPKKASENILIDSEYTDFITLETKIMGEKTKFNLI